MAFWYILWSFGIFFTFWYVWNKKNLATLVGKVTQVPRYFAEKTDLRDGHKTLRFFSFTFAREKKHKTAKSKIFIFHLNKFFYIYFIYK
jgi:hypothetical protein